LLTDDLKQCFGTAFARQPLPADQFAQTIQPSGKLGPLCFALLRDKQVAVAFFHLSLLHPRPSVTSSVWVF
jgi:hypothetical protein